MVGWQDAETQAAARQGAQFGCPVGEKPRRRITLSQINISHLCRKSLVHELSRGVDQEFAPDPGSNTVRPANPSGERTQPAGEGGRVSEVTFDLGAMFQQLPAEAGLS
jgi:hypothetical protein